MLQEVRASENMPSWTVQNYNPTIQNDIFHTQKRSLGSVAKRKTCSALESNCFLALEPNRQQTLKDIFIAVAERSNEQTAEAWLEQQLKNPNKFSLPWKMERRGLPAPHEAEKKIIKKKARLEDARNTKHTELPKEVLTHASRAESIAKRVETIKPKTRKIYQTLAETALTIAEAREYSPHTTHVTFFCPTEIVAHALEMHRSTLWRHLKILEELGLVDHHDYKSTLNGNTVSAGKLWQIKLNPNEGSPASIQHEDFKYKWRDLENDVKSGKTAYNALHPTTQQSKELLEGKTSVNQILTFALPNEVSSLTSSMTVAENPLPKITSLESILDLRYIPKPDRNHMVDLTAKAIAQALQDTRNISIKFYRKCLWNLLRHHDKCQDHFLTFHEFVSRAKSEVKEGKIHSGGAFLISLLRDWGSWDELQRTPKTKVGTSNFRKKLPNISLTSQHTRGKNYHKPN
jgi:hypothetical protein